MCDVRNDVDVTRTPYVVNTENHYAGILILNFKIQILKLSPRHAEYRRYHSISKFACQLLRAMFTVFISDLWYWYCD